MNNEEKKEEDARPEPESADIELAEHSIRSIEFPNDERGETDPFDLSPAHDSHDAGTDSDHSSDESTSSNSDNE